MSQNPTTKPDQAGENTDPTADAPDQAGENTDPTADAPEGAGENTDPTADAPEGAAKAKAKKKRDAGADEGDADPAEAVAENQGEEEGVGGPGVYVCKTLGEPKSCTKKAEDKEAFCKEEGDSIGKNKEGATTTAKADAGTQTTNVELVAAAAKAAKIPDDKINGVLKEKSTDIVNAAETANDDDDISVFTQLKLEGIDDTQLRNLFHQIRDTIKARDQKAAEKNKKPVNASEPAVGGSRRGGKRTRRKKKKRRKSRRKKSRRKKRGKSRRKKSPKRRKSRRKKSPKRRKSRKR